MLNSPKTQSVLGMEVVNARKERVLTEVDKKIKEKGQFWLVTAYSETFLEAQDNLEFAQAIKKADWIVLDGVAGWAALDYPTQGLKVALNILQGKYADRPVGAEMVRHWLEERKHKIFLLGGFGGVAQRLAQKYDCGFEEDGPNQDKRIIDKINKFKPDILLVAYGRVKQELWIAQNLDQLKCKVVMGVGSAFDEIAGEGMWASQTPQWMQRMGLKWLWRLLHDPKHLVRSWRAAVVFPWRIFKQA